MDSASSAQPSPNRRCTPAQLRAMREYRQRFGYLLLRHLSRLSTILLFRKADELKTKGRARMARLRHRVAESDSAEREAYRTRAREYSQRFRVRNQALLANAQRVKRAYNFIDKHGFDAWATAYDQRTGATMEGRKEGDHTINAEEASTSTTPAFSGVSTYGHEDAEINDFLDNHDPTTHPDYIPKPGETRFFQRGKWRWY
ncbi:hypothetical protein C8R43DRAFT_1118027 [Mycena crocata]|nr:hypothetical protein C8R43DRAFT_1118027 [Mycena crocata]